MKARARRVWRTVRRWTWRGALAWLWRQVRDDGGLYWSCETRGQRRAEHGAEYLAVRLLWPAVIIPIQTGAWSGWWHNLTDRQARPGRQFAAAAWTVAALYWLGPTPLALAAGAPAVVVLAFGVGRAVYPHTTRGRVRTMFPADKVATWRELRQPKGVAAHAVRQAALYARPSIKAAVTPEGAEWPSPARLARVSARECGTPIGKTAAGPPIPLPVYTSVENGLGIIGAPRTVKSTLQEDQLLYAPGAALCTQTKGGTWDETSAVRREHSKSGTLHLFDPEGQVPDEKSTFVWPPDLGCADELVAARRAGAFADAAVKLGEDGEWLAEQAGAVLQTLLLLADVIPERDMRSVRYWSTSLDRAKKAHDLMCDPRYRDRIPDGWADDMWGLVTNQAARTVGALFMALKGAVGFMNDSRVAALCCPPRDPKTGAILAPTFNVPDFLADLGTVYLIGTDRPTQKTGPLLSAFTDYVVEEAKLLAPPLPGKRLDPPLHLTLDEVTNVIPMPLPRWMADTGGRGITATWSAQSFSQLVERWGEQGAKTVWNATTTKVFAGGTSEPDDLMRVSQLCNLRKVLDADGNPTDEESMISTMSTSMLRRIPPWHALLIHGSMRETIIKVKRPGLRRDVIAAKLRAKLRPPQPSLPAVPTAPVLAAAPETADA